MRTLLLSAYDAASHRYWREQLQAGLATVEFTTLTLPPRYFNWRIRGNSLTWSQKSAEVLNAPFDLCVATSMVDLATLRGLTPALSRLPTVLYFHENQCAYPVSKKFQYGTRRIEPQMVQLYSAIAADVLVFNSDYNRQSFLSGLAALLKLFPDGVPPGLVATLRAKSKVLPVPLDGPVRPMRELASAECFHLVWNHRWEYDKGPDRLLAFLKVLPESLRLCVHIVGQSFRRVPPVFEDIHNLLESRGWLGEWGYIEDDLQYFRLLERCDFVLSTAEHDFQGLAVLESVIRGCRPLVPDRLAYPEFLPQEFLYKSMEDHREEAQAMKTTFLGLINSDTIPQADLNGVLIEHLMPHYDNLFSRVAARSKL